MNDYPDNSYNSREKGDRKNEPNRNEKKLEKVVSGETKKYRKSEAKKFLGLFTPEDTDNIKNFIVMDIIVPGIKNAIADVVSIMLFGEANRAGRSIRDGRSKLSYQRYYRDDREERRDYVHPRTSTFEYDDVLFETRGDAEMVLDQLVIVLEQYGLVSVADFYDLAGVTCRSYTANKYGWTDLRNAKVVRIRDGYILQLPRTIQIT